MQNKNNNLYIRTRNIYNINNMDVEININDFKMHPIYTIYGSYKEGNITKLSKNKLFNNRTHSNGYKFFNIYFNSKHINYLLYRFIWECFNDLIPNDKVIDHIDNNKHNKKLDNLKLLTPSENSKKSARDRFFYKHMINNKFIKPTCIDTGEIDYFHSTHSIERNLGINCGLIYMICTGKNNAKTAKCKINNNFYTFEYVDNLPENYDRPKRIVTKKMTPEQKKEKIKNYYNSPYLCLNCCKLMKIKNKQYHLKMLLISNENYYVFHRIIYITKKFLFLK